MIIPTKTFVDSSLRCGRRILATAALAVGLSACAATAVKEPQVVSYEYQPDTGFVRIEHLEPGAMENAHPFQTSAPALRQALSGIKVRGSLSAGPVPLFSADELDELLPPLAAALGKAGAKQDVTFALAGARGPFGSFSGKTITTGRVFVRDDKFNLIIGRAHEIQHGNWNRDESDLFMPGTRLGRVETIWRLDPGSNAKLADAREDWVTIETKAIPAVAPTVPGSAPSVDSRYQEIDTKLKLLEQLKANGRITEEEYRERRRAILQGI